MSARGFVLTPTWRLVHGRPAVQLHAVLESGEPALIVDDRSVPYAFVRAADAGRVTGARVVATELRTLADDPVARVEVATPQDLTALRRRCEADGVPTYEADLRFAYRWLIDRGIRGGFVVDGPSEVRPGVGRTWTNPATLAPADVVPRLRLVSLDIETSLDGRRLYSIAVAGAGGDRVWMVGAAPVEGAVALPDEAGVVRAFVEHVRAADPDVLTGWNVCDFDLAVLLAVAKRCGVRLALGRDAAEPTLARDRG
jgi:DNA polymerase-2